MQPDDMEKAFRQKMKSLTPAWDKAKNWDAIESRLPQQRKRRPAWLFWLLGGAILTGAVFVWGLSRTDKTPTVSTNVLANETIENQPIKPIEDARGNWTESHLPQAESTVPAAAANNQRNDPAPVFSEKTKAQNSPGARVTEPKWTGFPGKKTQDLAPLNLSSGPATETDGVSAASISPQVANTLHAPADNDEPVLLRRTTLLEKLPVKTQLLNLLQPEIGLPAAMAEQVEVVKNKPRFGLEIYGGIGQPMRRFSDVSPETQAYVNERQEWETVLENIEAGVLVNARFRGGWSLATGLEFQKINERFRWQQVTTETLNVYSDTAYFYFDAVNQRQFIGDTVQATVTESRRVTNFNTHTFFNVPVLVGVEKHFPLFSLRAQGGPVLQFYRGFEGVIFDRNGELSPAGEQDNYQNKMALSLQAGLDVSRPAGRLGEVFFGLQYRHGLTSLTGAATGFQQRYGSLGARLGWRF